MIKELISGPFASGKTTKLLKMFDEFSKANGCVFVTQPGLEFHHKRALSFGFAERNALDGRTIFMDDADAFICGFGIYTFNEIIENADVYATATNSDFFKNYTKEDFALNVEIANMLYIEKLCAEKITKLKIRDNKYIPEDYGIEINEIYGYSD